MWRKDDLAVVALAVIMEAIRAVSPLSIIEPVSAIPMAWLDVARCITLAVVAHPFRAPLSTHWPTAIATIVVAFGVEAREIADAIVDPSCLARIMAAYCQQAAHLDARIAITEVIEAL